MRQIATFLGLEVWFFERINFLEGLFFPRFRVRVLDDVVLKACMNKIYIYQVITSKQNKILIEKDFM